MELSESPLGKKSTHTDQYTADLLFPVLRQNKRSELHIIDFLPFKGFDLWTAFELSWLNEKGKPIVAIGEFIFPCTSVFLIESKSLKLYFNSFNNTKFNSLEEVKITMQNDLSRAAGEEVIVKLYSPTDWRNSSIQFLSGECIDDNDIECDSYTVTPEYLICEGEEDFSETIYSNLLRSNCLMTGQPDWASVQISYTGQKINHDHLLKYIVSFRNHIEFGEHCVERIFTDIMQYCAPTKLTVYARYTRRGGIDINPYRSTEDCQPPENIRLPRQ